MARRNTRRAAKPASSGANADPTLSAIIRRERTEAAVSDPTPERVSHARKHVHLGDIVRNKNQSRDAKGRIVAPYRTVDTLEAMEAAGTITRDMRIVGERFSEDFYLAHLDSLQAASLDRAGVGTHGAAGGPTIGHASEGARLRVLAAVQTVGGADSDGGACLWHVLGLQQSLRQWAIERTLAGRRLSPAEASGILRTVLGVLAGNKH